MIETLEQYLETLDDNGKHWVCEFCSYVTKNYPHLELTMFRQRPMFKRKDSYLDGYVMFTAAKSHFTFHTLNFALVEEAKTLLNGAQFGKGSIKVKYKNDGAIPILKSLCDKEIKSW